MFFNGLAKAPGVLYAAVEDIARFVAAGPEASGEPVGRGMLVPETVAEVYTGSRQSASGHAPSDSTRPPNNRYQSKHRIASSAPVSSAKTVRNFCMSRTTSASSLAATAARSSRQGLPDSTTF